MTYYLEDAPNMNTFNYAKKGFEKPPTDYYLRTFFKAMDQDTSNNCYLDRSEYEVNISIIYYEFLSSS